MVSHSRRRFLRAAAAVPAVASAGCTAISTARSDIERPLSTAPDAVFRAGNRRQGYRSDQSVPDDAEIDWRIDDVNTGEHTAAKASVVPAPTGDLVIPGDSGDVLVVSPSGEVRWRRTVTGATRGFHGTPVVANGAIYIGAYDGVLYALDLETGATHWRANLGDAIGSSPAYRDGVVYIAVEYYTPDGSVFGVDAATGEVVWEDTRPTNHPHSSIAIDRDAGRLVVGSNDGTLYAWEFPSHEPAWSFPTDGPIKGPIATYDGGAIFGSWDHNVYRVDLSDGSREWAFEADGKVMSGPAIDPERGVAYVGSHDTRLYALDAASGEELWRFDTGGWLIGCATTTGDRILVGSYDGNVYALDATGEELWRVGNRGWVTSAPLPHDGAVYYTERATEERSGGAYRLTPP